MRTPGARGSEHTTHLLNGQHKKRHAVKLSHLEESGEEIQVLWPWKLLRKNLQRVHGVLDDILHPVGSAPSFSVPCPRAWPRGAFDNEGNEEGDDEALQCAV
jgi:hypothetical protein